MKYKDFKMLSTDDMKQIRGGYAAACRATAECRYGGTVTIDCPNADAGCSASDYGAAGYSGNGSAYCSEGGIIKSTLCAAQ